MSSIFWRIVKSISDVTTRSSLIKYRKEQKKHTKTFVYLEQAEWWICFIMKQVMQNKCSILLLLVGFRKSHFVDALQREKKGLSTRTVPQSYNLLRSADKVRRPFCCCVVFSFFFLFFSFIFPHYLRSEISLPVFIRSFLYLASW